MLIVLVLIMEFSVFLDPKIVTMSLNRIIFVGKRSDVKYFISLPLLKLHVTNHSMVLR